MKPILIILFSLGMLLVIFHVVAWSYPYTTYRLSGFWSAIPISVCESKVENNYPMTFGRTTYYFPAMIVEDYSNCLYDFDN